jgi:ubiquinone/menaquinone biosynthesis C-methylase UbiE
MCCGSGTLHRDGWRWGTVAGKVDWADEIHRKMIVDQRRHLWRDDTIAMYAGWMGLHNGIRMLDVGCGQGYLGRLYWPHCGRGSLYVGVDTSAGLLEQGEELSREWARGGRARFARGDAYALPFPDGTFDWTCCQTLLMHAEHPEKMLAEMIRVTRPGGLVSCNEPDNEIAMSAQPFGSLPEPAFEDRVLLARVSRHWILGRIRLGLGDWRIGPRVPSLLQEQGLVEIDIRVNDLVDFVQPPYDTPRMQFRLMQMKDGLEEGRRRRRKATADPFEEEHRKCFFAGGGTRYTYDKYLAFQKRQQRRYSRLIRKQLDSGTYIRCPMACSFFCIKGVKPLG